MRSSPEALSRRYEAKTLSMQDERLVRQVVSRMSSDDLHEAATRIAMTTPYTASELASVGVAIEDTGVSFDAFLEACAKLGKATALTLAQAGDNLSRAFAHVGRGLPKTPRALPAHVQFLPAVVRAVIRLGEQQRFVIRFDSTHAKIRRGRVFLPVELVTADGGTSLAIIGERSWVRSQIEDWQSLGFDVELYKGPNMPSALATR